MTRRSGIRPPSSDVNGGALDVSWGSGKTVAVVNGVADTPFVTGPLPRGVYTVQATDPLWLNVGLSESGDLDHEVTSENAATPEALGLAPKLHGGGDWAIAVDDDERIAVKAVTGTVDVRIFKGA